MNNIENKDSDLSKVKTEDKKKKILKVIFNIFLTLLAGVIGIKLSISVDKPLNLIFALATAGVIAKGIWKL